MIQDTELMRRMDRLEEQMEFLMLSSRKELLESRDLEAFLRSPPVHALYLSSYKNRVQIAQLSNLYNTSRIRMRSILPPMIVKTRKRSRDPITQKLVETVEFPSDWFSE